MCIFYSHYWKISVNITILWGWSRGVFRYCFHIMVLYLWFHLYFADKFKIFISIYLISDLIFLFIIDIFCTTLIPQHDYKLNFISAAKSSVLSWVSTSVAVHVPQDVTTHLMNHLSLHPTLRTCYPQSDKGVDTRKHFIHIRYGQDLRFQYGWHSQYFIAQGWFYKLALLDFELIFEPKWSQKITKRIS